jgi:beta-lactamase superfamily II metal-dependent hydrolase
VSAETLFKLKSEDGIGQGILFLADRINNTFTGAAPQIDFQGLQFRWFYNEYPQFDDENNLSLALYTQFHGIGVLFPGDLEGAGWRSLMTLTEFLDALRNARVLVASHHGRENGWCDELRKLCKPYYVVISDKGYMYDTQKTVPLYRSIAIGGPFRGEPERRVLTTRNDGRIGFTFTDPQNWYAY